MKAAVVIAITLSLILPAAAQDIPKTVELKNASGEVVGTATFSGDGATTYRDAKGELAGSSRISNGRITFYDPSGNVVRVITREKNTLVIHDRDGRVIGTTPLEATK